jgi:hypothetical protein
MADKNRTHTTHTQYYTQEGDFRALCKAYPDGNYKKTENSEWFQLVVMDIEFTWFLQ